MKKLFLIGALALFGTVNLNAQTSGYPKLGLHIGLPVGSAADVFSFNVGADVAYLWTVAPAFDLGLATGYSYYFVKSNISGSGNGMIPVAATGKYTLAPNFFLGADVGYAFFTEKGSDGGFYYQPKIGYESGNTEFYLSFKGISNNGTISSINAGVGFKIR